MRSTLFTRIMFSITFVLASMLSFAQSDIGITLNITPPYSPRFADYAETPGKVLLIVRNNTNQVKNIYLRGMVTGDNGISMSNDATAKPSSPVVLQPFQVYTANNNNLQELFSVSKYKMTGITPSQIAAKNGLPEGNYNICIRAYDYNTGQPLSADAPLGCKMLPLANLEPPIPLKPMANEEVKGLEPQNVIFSWTVPAGAEPGTQYKLRVIEMLDPKKNINDAYNSGTTPTFFEVTVSANVFVFGPGQPKLVNGRKYAWAVTAIPGPKKIAYKNNGTGEVRSFTFVKPEPPKPAGPVITLIAPADKASFDPIGGLDKSIDLKWDYTNPNKQSFYEDAWVYEVKEGQTPEEAVKKNERVNSTKEPYKAAWFSGNNVDGKTYAWVVTLNDAGKIYTSSVRTFTIGSSQVAGQKFSNFEFGGYNIVVSSLKDKGGYKYSGAGSTQLYKDGPYVTIWFDDLTIKPFSKKNGKDFSDWRVVSGSVKSKPLYKKYIYYTMPNEYEGDLRFQIDYATFNAAMKAEAKSDGTFYMTEKYGENGVNVTGRFTWETYYVYKAENGEEKTAVYTCEVGSAPFTFDKTFSETQANYLLLKSPDGYNTMKLTSPESTTFKLVPTLYITNNGKTPKFSFDGYYEIPALKNGKPGIKVSFNKQEKLGFETPVTYSIPLTKDGSVVASFDKVKLYIGFLPAISIPQLNMKFTKNGKSYNFNFTKAFFGPKDGLYCVEKKLANGDINIGGFNVTLENSLLELRKSTLNTLLIDGSVYVPFLKQTAAASFHATEEGISNAGVGFPTDQPTTLYQNVEGDKCVFQASFGSFTDDRIVLNGYINFSNTDKEKNFNLANIPTPDIYIKANGDVGIEGPSSLDGAPVPYQKSGKYNGFKFTPFNINLSKIGSKYRIGFNGMLVLADNLSSDTNTPNFSTSVDFDASSIKGGGPPANTEASFSSSEVGGGLHDATVDFGVKFKYYNNDPVYGKGFMSEGYYGIQQPDPMQVHAKMIVAKAPEGFNYWFFEAGQENVMQIPTGVLDVGIYGFTGRVYYKMGHQGTNIYKDDYVPDNGKFLGIYGLTQLKTLTDNGVKFWGKVGFEVVTNNSGLESICFRGDGEIMTDGVGSKGMIRAHDCQLNFYWDPKEVYGEFNVDADFKGMVSASASVGFDITPDKIDIWGDATSAKLFNSSACGSANFGFRLTQDDARLAGNFNLINIHKGFDFGICEPSVDVVAKLLVDAHVNYSPFQFQGGGTMYGHIHVAGCRLHGNIGLKLNAQLMFPQPTCICAGVCVETPLKDFCLNAGIKNGSVIFSPCY